MRILFNRCGHWCSLLDLLLSLVIGRRRDLLISCPFYQCDALVSFRVAEDVAVKVLVKGEEIREVAEAEVGAGMDMRKGWIWTSRGCRCKAILRRLELALDVAAPDELALA